jgi:hypothetical protein
MRTNRRWGKTSPTNKNELSFVKLHRRKDHSESTYMEHVKIMVFVYFKRDRVFSGLIVIAMFVNGENDSPPVEPDPISTCQKAQNQTIDE